MQRNTMIVAVVLIVVVGGSLVVFLPQLLPRTEWRFQEGVTGNISVIVKELENCSITIEFVNDTGLMLKYSYIPGAGGVSVTQEPTNLGWMFTIGASTEGVVESGDLTITLGSSAVYSFFIRGDDLNVAIEYNEYSTLADHPAGDEFEMISTGGTLDLTISGASADLGYMQAFSIDADNLANANVDVILPTGTRGKVGLSDFMSIMTNNGWARGVFYYEKGVETLPAVVIEVHADQYNAWLR
ncbi:MAG: hypothetical protein ACFFEF_16475 [Candidatus Thorarchaeota archaeon]